MKALIKKLIQKYRFRKLDVPDSCNISLSASITSSRVSEFCRFAEKSDVRNSTIGDYSTIGRYSKITHTDIGKFCAISWDCTINAVSHPYNHLSIHAFPYVPHAGNFVQKRIQEHKRVLIGNDVWVGANSVIMPGVKVGDGAVIGANAVVTKDVPPYAIVGGVPAKIIKYRFSDEIILKLIELKWWNLDTAIIKDNIEVFQKPLSFESLLELEKNVCH